MEASTPDFKIASANVLSVLTNTVVSQISLTKVDE